MRLVAKAAAENSLLLLSCIAGDVGDGVEVSKVSGGSGWGVESGDLGFQCSNADRPCIRSPRRIGPNENIRRDPGGGAREHLNTI
jgi:hypothetical protein